MTEPVTIVSLALFQHMASRSARDCAGVRRKVQGGRFRREREMEKRTRNELRC